MKISEAKEIIKEAYENSGDLNSHEVLNSLYCLAEFSCKMLTKTNHYVMSIEDDLTQEMVIITHTALLERRFTFGCIQNYMQSCGYNYLVDYSKKNIDNSKVFVPFSTIEASELEELFIDDRTDDYEKFMSLIQLINRTIKRAKIKLQDNMITSTDVNLYLFPVLLCLFRQENKLIEKYPHRNKVVLKKIVYELNEELDIYNEK